MQITEEHAIELLREAWHGCNRNVGEYPEKNDVSRAFSELCYSDDWVEFNPENIPEPLSHQSGGHFWIVQDFGKFGLQTQSAWWTGSEFDKRNMSIITHFKPRINPTPPIKERTE